MFKNLKKFIDFEDKVRKILKISSQNFKMFADIVMFMHKNVCRFKKTFMDFEKMIIKF